MKFRATSEAILALLFIATSIPQAALAQVDAGQIVIDVMDAGSKSPVDLARILLDGPVMTTEYSGANGAVRFTSVPDGIYRARVFKRGYQSVTSDQFEVVNGRLATVTVTLAKVEQLKVIGTVSVKSSASVSTSSISDSSAQRRLSDTLADALNKISGVSVSTSSNDSDATQTVSLEGHDASQTSLTLDGVPLNAPGTAGNLGAIASDLFRGASTSFGPQAGALGGGVNFSTLQPTLSWQGRASLSAGSYGKYNWALSESGTLGKLGVALQHTTRDTPSLANGMRFLDASGLNYEHDAVNAQDGDLLKLRYQMANQTFTGTYLASNTSNSLICLQITGPLPCGYGPDNTIGNTFRLYSLADSALVGATALNASIFQTRLSSDRNLLNRYLNGIPDPSGFISSSMSSGASLNAILPAKERHTLSISATTVSTKTDTEPLLANGRQYTVPGQTSSYSSITLNDSIRSNTKLRLNEHVGFSQASNAPASALGGIAATWSPSSADTFTGSYDLGGVAPHAGRNGVITDPQSLRFDCNGNVAYGSAPGDQPSASSSTSARLSWAHNLRIGSVNTSIYRQVQNGVVLPTQVNGSVLAGSFPPGYFNLAQGVYDSSAGCNAGTAPFGPQNIYFSVPVGGVQRVYEGAQIAANLSLGNLNVQPYYNITVAKANTADPRIDNAYSIVHPGAQLPNTPLHKAGITLDYKAPRSAIEGLFSAQYTGSNNSQNLPAYTIFDAGINAHLTHGDLTFAANNIFNTFGGIFASNDNAVPYTTIGGTQIATIARPNSPRQYSITYTVPFGFGVKTTSTSSVLAQAVSGAEGGGPNGGGRRGGFMAGITPLPATAPTNPFALNTANTACDADAQKNAQPVLSQLQAYTQTIEAAKTGVGYPASVPGAPIIPGVAVGYHKIGASYALSLEVQRSVPALAKLPACLSIHLAQPEDVASRGLYQPQSSLFFRPSLQFMPAVGFYVARPVQTPGQASFRLYKLPATPPGAPFQLVTTDSCTAEAKPVATRMLAELKSIFTGGKTLPSWKVTSHTASGGTWYELQNDDVTTVPALLNCGHVSAATTDEIKAAGFDGMRPPELNYAPKLGLYIVRGNGQGGNGQPRDSSAPAGAPPDGGPPPPPPGAPPAPGGPPSP